MPCRNGPLSVIAALLAAMSCGAAAAQDFANWYSNDASGCFVAASGANEALRLGDFDAAVRSFTAAIEYQRNTCGSKDHEAALVQLIEGRARALSALGRWREAFDAVPRKGTSGFFLMNETDADWIMPIVDAVIGADPGNLDARWARAKLYGETGAHAQAVNEYGTILRAVAGRRDDQVDALIGRARALRKTGALDLALSNVNGALQLDPKPSIYFLRSEIHVDMGNPDLAIMDMTSVIGSPDLQGRISPTAVESVSLYLERRGDLYAQTGRPDAAMADFAALLAAQPESTRYRRRHLHVALRAGRDDLAAEDIRFLNRADPTYMRNPQTQCELQGLKADRYGDPQAAGRLNEAWKVGEIIGLVPLDIALGVAGDTHRKGWAALQAYVGEHAPAGPGPAPLPEFRGSGEAPLRQAVRFALSQHANAKAALADRFGAADMAAMSLSAAGHMAYALNRRGITGMNRQLVTLVEDNGGDSALPCTIWQPVARRLGGTGDARAVAEAWSTARGAMATGFAVR